MKRVVLLLTFGLCFQLGFSSLVQAAPNDATYTKELNFVFLHGAGGNTCSFQLLEDCIQEQLPANILLYEQADPNTKIRISVLKRCYPGYVDVQTWAQNIADSIDKHFHDKENLILIGHSMGGKAALYALAHNIGGLADRVVLLITINSPVKSLNSYYVAGGLSPVQYCRIRWLQSDQGVCNSVTYYDSSEDGSWVSSNGHWLAFISGEAAPLSEQFDIGGLDGWPRNIDDGIVPISAQYSPGADVIYYGEYGHNDFAVLNEVAEFMADQILCYIFGRSIECSVFARGGVFKHEASWLPGRDYWVDVAGGIPASTGSLLHENESYTKWQEWEDVVGLCSPEAKKDSYYVSRAGSFPFLASIMESRWLHPDNPEDCRLYLRTRAAPRSRVEVNWSVHRIGLLPSGQRRDRYEVEIITGTPLTKIARASWATDEFRDLRIRIWSEADRPFRWFKADWRVYLKESRLKKIIDEIDGQALSGKYLGG